MTNSSDADDPESLCGQVISQKFRIERVLGQGGMGAVYVAEHLYTKRRGALKLLRKSFASLPDVVERFIREASAAGVIDSPHIVETIDAGKLESGEPYMFMELLDGAPVDELLDRRSRLRFDEAADIIAQAAEGLARAHEAGIVHRDIKPGNMFLVAGDKPFVKLLDFGISKFAPAHGADAHLTLEGRMLGTPSYMSPEQVRGQRDIDARTDVYSLGVVLYEMLVGMPPFVGESLMDLSVRIHEGDYVPVSELRAETPDGFDAMLARALAVDREQRFSSALEFRARLIELCGTRSRSFAPTVLGSGSASPSEPVKSAQPTAPGAEASERSDNPLPSLASEATIDPMSEPFTAGSGALAAAPTQPPRPSQPSAFPVEPHSLVAAEPLSPGARRWAVRLGGTLVISVLVALLSVFFFDAGQPSRAVSVVGARASDVVRKARTAGESAEPFDTTGGVAAEYGNRSALEIPVEPVSSVTAAATSVHVTHPTTPSREPRKEVPVRPPTQPEEESRARRDGLTENPFVE